MRVTGVVAASVLVVSAVALAAGSSTPSLADRAVGSPVSQSLANAAAVSSLPDRDSAVGIVDLPARAPLALRSPKAATAAVTGTSAGPPLAVVTDSGPLAIPDVVLAAYKNAEAALAATQPGCHLPWSLLAGIGRIESGHAGGGRTDAAGTTVTPILGPVLDGRGAGDAVITDTDGGVHDGDAGHDRAVGPMQFIPGTWKGYAADGNGDGKSDPNNVFDAAVGAGKYLCSGNLDLRDVRQQTTAVLRYNNSVAYTANVLAWSSAYSGGAIVTAGLVGAIERTVGDPTDALATQAAAEAATDLPSETAVATTEPVVPDVALTPMPQPAFGIPGLPPLPILPCLIFCPPPPPAEQTTAPDPAAVP